MIFTNKLAKTLSGLALAFSFSHTAQATTVDWTISEFTNSVRAVNWNISSEAITLLDTVSGSFTYDADTNAISNVNLVSSLFGTNFSPLSSLSGVVSFGNGTQSYLFKSTLLTNAGGIVNVRESGGRPKDGSGWSYGIAGSATVTLTGTPQATAVPEPEVYAIMLAGLGLVGFAARRKKQAAKSKVLSQY